MDNAAGGGWVTDDESTFVKVLQAGGEPEYVPSTSRLIGAGGQQVFRFKAVEAGETTLRLVYKRPFEPDVTPTPEQTFAVQITVN